MSQVDRKAHAEALINLVKVTNWGGKLREGRTLALRAIDLYPEYVKAYFSKVHVNIRGEWLIVEMADVYLSVSGKILP